MQVLVINPNSTAAMTETIAEAARLAASPRMAITALNPPDTPPAIQGAADGAAAVPGVRALFDEAMAGPTRFDAAIIACFDDVGLAEIKPTSPIPVMGIGEAAFHVAALLGGTFSVVTTLDVSIPVIEDNIAAYGFSSRRARVRAAGVPVLAVTGADHGEARIAAEAERAVAEDGCRSIVLGCAAMAGLARQLTRDMGLPVIDGIAAAVRLTETLVNVDGRA